MLKKAILLAGSLAVGSLMLQGDAFAHGGGHPGGGHWGYHHHSAGGPFIYFGGYPYASDDYCYWTRWHGHFRRVCE